MLNIPGNPLNVVPETLFFVGDFPVTNTMTMAVFNLFFFILLCVVAQRFTVRHPGKLQLFLENIILIITGLLEQIIGNKKVAWKIMPLVTTLVIFILVSNLIMTLIPILSGFTYDGTPLFRSHTNDFNTTLALSFGMIALVQIVSIRKINIFRHLLKYFPIDKVIKGFRKGISAGLISIVDVFIGLLDIVSELAKIISLSLRLFGNMFAGELLIGVLMGILAIGLPIPMIGLTTLSGIIQAIVFGALTASFLSGVLKED